jgi:predicted dehydrogenase/threonine dehydrogenase-like Zn-dependent dehydrogenase
MKQILQSYRTGELWLADLPDPAVREGMVRVRTSASVVSAGTERMLTELARKSLLGKAQARPDLVRKVIRKIKSEGLSAALEKTFAKLDTPIPMGYSCAGHILELGQNVKGFQVGDLVACAGAGFANHAETNVVPMNLCARVPRPVSADDAAFATVGAIALQGVRQAQVQLGESVVVMGLGLIGLLTCQILKASGCKVYGVDPDPQRLALARELGVLAGCAPEGCLDLTAGIASGMGPDAVILAAATESNAPVETAAEMCRVKGRVVVVGMVGLNVPRDPFYRKELDLRFSMSYGPGRYDAEYEERGHDYPYGYVRWTEQRNLQAFLELVAEGSVSPSRLVTHRMDFDQALNAYEILAGKRPDAGKPLGIVLRYAEEPSIGLPATRPVAGLAKGERSDRPADRKVVLRPEAPATPDKGRIGAGFIGAGNFAKGVLLPAIRDRGGVDFRGICTAGGNTAVAVGRKFGFCYATSEPDDVLSDPGIQAVFIATRHDSHADLVRRAVQAGKHVFCEKPLCISPEELAGLEGIRTAAGAGPTRVVMVGFNRRFSPHLHAVRQALGGKAYPMAIVCRVNAGHIPDDHWVQNPEQGGGRIVGEMCHFVDACSFLCGGKPLRVHAVSMGGGIPRHGREDTVTVVLTYDNGSMATVHYFANGSADLPKERIEVFAGGLSAVVDDFRSTTFYGVRHVSLKGPQDKGHKQEMNAFLDAVRVGGPSPIPLDDLFLTSRVTFAVEESLRTGAVVKVGA